MKIANTPVFAERTAEIRKSFGLPEAPTVGGTSSASSTGNKPTQFVDLLADGLGKVNQMQETSKDQVHAMLSGADVSQAEVFTEMQKADMAFSFLVQLRNKLMQAYEEINAIRI